MSIIGKRYPPPVQQQQIADSNFVRLFKHFIYNDPGRTKILEIFDHKTTISFEEALAQYDTDNHGFDHIGSGSYADVFREKREFGLIFKLIRLLPDHVIDRVQTPSLNRATKYVDAFSEFQISAALSKLNRVMIAADGAYSCEMFPTIHRGFLTCGRLPTCFGFSPNESKGNSLQRSENIYSDYFLAIPRENMLIVMEDGGRPMRDVIDDIAGHPYLLLSIVKQIIIGFMIAESVFEFEHRDLHSGNVLLQPCADKLINYRMNRNVIAIPSFGYRVKMIDTTFSRIRIKQKVYFTDLSHLFDHFGGNLAELKMQDQCYEHMSRLIDGDWQQFCPKTNLIWIKYIIYKLLHAKAFDDDDDDDDDDVDEHNQNDNDDNNGTGDGDHYHHDDGGEIHSNKPAAQVREIFAGIERLLDKCADSTECFNAIVSDQTLNDCVKIAVLHY